MAVIAVRFVIISIKDSTERPFQHKILYPKDKVLYDYGK